MADKLPLETTVYSLSESPPRPDGESERRDDQRHMTLFRVGSIMIDGRRELCLIKNISAGGMMIRAYCALVADTAIVIELKSGQPVSGKVAWVRESQVGVTFDQPIDVIDILSHATGGPRPRMPRVEVDCHASLREGANVYRIAVQDVSQGGVKVRSDASLTTNAEIVVTLPGLEPQRGIVCWKHQGMIGLSFNRLLPLHELVGWLQVQREQIRAAG